MTAATVSNGLRRTTGALFLGGALAFAAAATMLSSTFDWPDILREPPEVVLPAFAAGGTSLLWAWFAVAWTYGILVVPVLLLPAALGRRDDPLLRAATFVGAASVLLSLIGSCAGCSRLPVWDLGGLLGSTLWGLWVLALGVAVLRRPALRAATGPAATRRSRRRPERALARLPDLPFSVR